MTGPVILPLPVHAVPACNAFSWLAVSHCHTYSLCVLLYLVNLCSSVAQVRLRCQKGIPPALRGRAWLYLSGGKMKKEQNQGKFQVRELSLSLPPHSFFYAVFWSYFIFKFLLQLLLKLRPHHKCYFWLRILTCSTRFTFSTASSKGKIKCCLRANNTSFILIWDSETQIF